MASNRRLSRINSLLKEVISDVVTQEVKNPNVGALITITRVDTSADLHHAKVYVSVIGSDEDKIKTLEGLNSAAGFIAINASKEVSMRYFPSLLFKIDETAAHHDRIDRVLEEIQNEQRQRQRSSSTDE